MKIGWFKIPHSKRTKNGEQKQPALTTGHASMNFFTNGRSEHRLLIIWTDSDLFFIKKKGNKLFSMEIGKIPSSDYQCLSYLEVKFLNFISAY